MVTGYYILNFFYHMKTVPGRPKVENLPNQNTVNKVHLLYPEQKSSKIKISKSKDQLPWPPHTNTHPIQFSPEPSISLRS